MSSTIAEIYAFHDSDANVTCGWCGASGKEVVTATLRAGLIDQADICTRCLVNALRVANGKKSLERKPVAIGKAT